MPQQTTTSKPNVTFQLLKWILSFFLLVSIGVISWLYLLPLPPYRLIPGHAFAVVNIELKPHVNPYMQYEWWQSVGKIPEIQRVAKNKYWLDSLSQKSPELFLLLQRERIWLSFHAVSREQIAWLAIFSSPVLERNQPHQWVIDLAKQIAQTYPLRCDTRRYDDFLIYELYDPRSGELVLELSFVKDFLICSSSGILLDDAIRTAQGKQTDAGEWLKPVLQPILPSVWQFYANTTHFAPTWKGICGFQVYADSSGLALTGNTYFPQTWQTDTALGNIWDNIATEVTVFSDWLIKNKRLLLKFHHVVARTHANGETTIRFLVAPNTVDNPFKVINTVHLAETAYSPFIPYYVGKKAVLWGIQDAEDIYYIFDEKGQVRQKLWLDDLASRQVVTHFYKQKSLFFWISADLLYAFNEAGKIQNGYPIRLPNVTVRTAFISPVLSQGFLLTDIAGNLTSYDWQGKPLKNWSSVSFQQRLIAPPIVLSYTDNPLLIGVGENALIKVFDHDGKLANGFPLYFETKLYPEIFIQEGDDLATSYIHFLSESGEHFVVNLEGKLISRTRLSYDATTDFFLFTDKQTNQFAYIASHKGNELTLYNLSHDKLATILLPYKTSPKLSFFDFGQTHSVVVVSYLDQKRTFLYYLNGEPITEQPLWTTQSPVFIRYDAQNRCYTVLKAMNKTISLVEVYEK